MHSGHSSRHAGRLSVAFVALHLLAFLPATRTLDLATPLVVAACALLPFGPAMAAGALSAVLAGLASTLGGTGWAAALATTAGQGLGVLAGAGLLRRTGLIAKRYDSPAGCVGFLGFGGALPPIVAALLAPQADGRALEALASALPIALGTLGWWVDLVERPRSLREAGLGMLVPIVVACAVAVALGRDPAPWLLAGLTLNALRQEPTVVAAHAAMTITPMAAAAAWSSAFLPMVTFAPADPLHLGLAVVVPLFVAIARASGRRMTHLAYHDPLTELPNRRLLLERLRAALFASRRTGVPVALVFIDLDGFKEVNDTHGHALGDALLCAVARRMRARVRAGDTVCRLGGDEFAVLLPAIADRAAAAEVALMLRTALARPFALGGEAFQVRFSGGIALAPEDGTQAEALLERADAAMYQAKRDGRDRVRARALP
jgi:diguanylate cyclase (GGDEF)-like protein